MSLKEIKKEGISFFSEAITKWNRLIQIYNGLSGISFNPNRTNLINEGDRILTWFQDNYPRFRNYSSFETVKNLENGKAVRFDPVFDVIFRGASISWIVDNWKMFAEELNQGTAHLRGHLSAISNLKEKPKESQQEIPLIFVRKILSRFHQVANQLKRRRAGKRPFSIEDEYDVQYLLHALLKIEFDDIKKEEWTPSYAGGASRIDFVLKKSGILIETKKTSQNLREGEIGKHLIIDIVKYAEYPGVNTLVCFVYDPANWIENPQGLEHELEQLSTEKLAVEVLVQPRG